MEKTYQLKLTSAVSIDGEIKIAGAVIEVGERVARDLLQRGKAVPDDTAPPAEVPEVPAKPAKAAK